MSTIQDIYDDLFGERAPFIGPLPAPKPDPIGTNPFHDLVRFNMSTVHPVTLPVLAQRVGVSGGAVNRVVQMLVWNGEAERIEGKLVTYRRLIP